MVSISEKIILRDRVFNISITISGFLEEEKTRKPTAHPSTYNSTHAPTHAAVSGAAGHLNSDKNSTLEPNHQNQESMLYIRLKDELEDIEWNASFSSDCNISLF